MLGPFKSVIARFYCTHKYQNIFRMQENIDIWKRHGHDFDGGGGGENCDDADGFRGLHVFGNLLATKKSRGGTQRATVIVILGG